MSYNPTKKYNKGMTLVETLVALSIFLVIMVAVATFEMNVFSYQGSISGSFNNSQTAEIVLKKITRELRGMSSPANGAYPLTVAGTSTISFFSDVNGDGIVEPVNYGSDRVSFEYFDGNEATTTDISAIRFVRVSLPPYSVFVELRNLKTNI